MERSIEETPVWAVSLVCLMLILLAIITEESLEFLTKFLHRKQRKSLKQALENIKTELMIMGFISLLLTVLQDVLVKICVTEAAGNSFLPCNGPSPESKGSSTKALSYCEAKGMISLISREGIKQLHIFIFVLTVFHVLCCILTMALGVAKMRIWEAWEEQTRTLSYDIEYDPRRFRLTRETPFGRRHLILGNDHPILRWLVSFLRQFSSSVTQADYFTLRNGFMMAHFSKVGNFNFQKFLRRTFDNDFSQLVGISFWLWMFSILFIFLNAHVFYDHLWLPFVPLLIVLAVGTKLQVIITKMCLESYTKTMVVRGPMVVKPSDSLFWFSQPRWLLHLIHFILFQNSFQLAFLTWTWYEFGLRSCFHWKKLDISLRMATGLMVQFVCGYVTLPVYALVTQMGSSLNEAVLGERVVKGLKHWHSVARHNLARNNSLSTRSSESRVTHKCEGSLSNVPVLDSAEYEPCPHSTFTNNSSDVAEELVLPKNIVEGKHDGEISFATFSCKGQHRSNPITEFTTCETTNEMSRHKILGLGTVDGEISFRTSAEKDQPHLVLDRNSYTKEIIADATRGTNIRRGRYSGGFIFRTTAENYQHQPTSSMDSMKTKMDEDLLGHENLKRGTYDGEISFGASWKE